jgi:hypothetical protein
MWPNYHDITERLGTPKWWMPEGVPRYCEFSPNECGVYVDMVALIEITCQSCGAPFLVVSECDKISRFGAGDRFALPSAGDIGSFHYGDPPIHGCVGDTMNVTSVRVREFWRKHHARCVKDGRVVDFSYFDWERAPECEVDVEPVEVGRWDDVEGI